MFDERELLAHYRALAPDHPVRLLTLLLLKTCAKEGYQDPFEFGPQPRWTIVRYDGSEEISLLEADREEPVKLSAVPDLMVTRAFGADWMRRFYNIQWIEAKLRGFQELTENEKALLKRGLKAVVETGPGKGKETLPLKAIYFHVVSGERIPPRLVKASWGVAHRFFGLDPEQLVFKQPANTTTIIDVFGPDWARLAV